MQNNSPLQGLTLVVTRPRDQAARTAVALRAAGARVIEFPGLAINPINAAILPRDLTSATGIIFVSANAVAHGVPVLKRGGEMKAAIEIFAIGRATAAALADAGFTDVVTPQQSIDSEGLLAMPQLHRVRGRHMILVKGDSELGGRRMLEQTLVGRGARVTLLECYRRAPLVPDIAACEALRDSLAAKLVQGCFALSIETLDSLMNIFSRLNISAQLQSQLVLLVPNPRVANAARTYGFERTAEVPLTESALVMALTELKPRLLTPFSAHPH